MSNEEIEKLINNQIEISNNMLGIIEESRNLREDNNRLKIYLLELVFKTKIKRSVKNIAFMSFISIYQDLTGAWIVRRGNKKIDSINFLEN